MWALILTLAWDISRGYTSIVVWVNFCIFLILFILSPGWILLGNLIKFLLLEAFPGFLKNGLGALFLWSYCILCFKSSVNWDVSSIWLFLPWEQGLCSVPLGVVMPAKCMAHSRYWGHMGWINTFFWRGLLTCGIKILGMCIEIAKQIFVDWISSA